MNGFMIIIIMKPHSALKGMVPAMIAKQQKTFNNTTKLIEEISLN